MKRFYWLMLLMLAVIASCGEQQNAATAKTKRPNIVIILADDLGYSDLGCYGGEIATPNLDYLAAHGLRFTQFYNTSRCCPTRASLLTGLYNQQAGIGHMTTDQQVPGYRGYLTENTVTLAEVLKTAGYHTAMSGKWHVSNTIEQPTGQAQLKWLNHQASHPSFSPLEQYPINRGFEKYYGNIWGVVDYFDPFALVHDSTAVESVPAGYYHSDAINDTAAAYINAMSKEESPFFIYVAETAPHWPLQALPEDIKKYEDTYKVGWDSIRAGRYRRMVEKELIDPELATISPRLNADESWDKNPHKVWDARAMAVHAAMVDRMDQGIGRILEALLKTGELDNTVIFFLSDNGASPENCMRYGPGFDRPGETREGKAIAYPVDKNENALPGPEEVFASIGADWANVANTPYRYAKAQSYEGGIHTPMIAFWPAGLNAPAGGMTNHVGHVMDFMATVIELSGASYPEQFNGHSITPTTGISLVPVLKGKEQAKHDTLYNEHFSARYIRDDEWKLVSLSGDTTWHLYHINTDQTELEDVKEAHPEVVQRLAARWQVWADQHQVFPKPN